MSKDTGPEFGCFVPMFEGLAITTVVNGTRDSVCRAYGGSSSATTNGCSVLDVREDQNLSVICEAKNVFPAPSMRFALEFGTGLSSNLNS